MWTVFPGRENRIFQFYKIGMNNHLGTIVRQALMGAQKTVAMNLFLFGF